MIQTSEVRRTEIWDNRGLNMLFSLHWKEGREERFTDTIIPEGKTWEEVQEYILLATKKAYKYSDEEIPEGLDIMS